MSDKYIYPHITQALRIVQPLGVFYVVSLPAWLVLDVAYSDRLRAEYLSETQTYRLDGNQREPQQKRLEAITGYINRLDASFPNAIILAANHRMEETSDDVDTSEQSEPVDENLERDWIINERENGSFELKIPTNAKVAAIIDGQHRLFAFAKADSDRLNMDLVCAIFIDLPKPFQAQLFATINSTQKPVDKSLTYEQFGYNVIDEKPSLWTPDKLAVFLTRRLSTEMGSPLKGRIIIAPKKDQGLEKLTANPAWQVSTAVIVEGIMRLYSSNPKRDTANMLEGKRHTRKDIKNLRIDRSPLRELYITDNDVALHQIVLNFLKACETLFWRNANSRSFIRKTVGVQALFDILRNISESVYASRDISPERFENILAPASDIDFSNVEFQNASGSGRSLIARRIRDAIGLGKAAAKIDPSPR